MPALKAPSDPTAHASVSLPLLRSLVLLRVAANNGATRAEMVRDLSGHVSHKLSPGEWRARSGEEMAALLSDQLATESRGRLTVTAAGRSAADDFLGRKCASQATWADLRDGRLIAKALGLEPPGATRLKHLKRPEGLRALVVQQAFGLPLKGNQSPSSLRAALAVLALERAFGNKIKTGLGGGTGFSAKAGRMLAGQLSARPRDFGTDGRLIAGLAAEAIDARQTDLDSLRSAILRTLFTRALSHAVGRNDKSSEDKRAKLPATGAARTKKSIHRHDSNRAANPPLPAAANDTGLPGGAARPQQQNRPDPKTFARCVQAAARTCSEGWPGNRKAMIAHVWNVVSAERPEWGLSEIEFKCMLAEAHRTGLLVLASADLKQKGAIAELDASAISYKNTTWHYVRVEEAD